MSQTLVPLFYDGQDQDGPPLSFKSHKEIKGLRKAGQLDGWYQRNGSVFVIYRKATPEFDFERLIAAGNMSDAWVPRQSGWAGPLVLQMVTQRIVTS